MSDCKHPHFTRDAIRVLRPGVFSYRCPDCGREIERDLRRIQDAFADPRTVEILTRAGCFVAQDVLRLGCTGLMSVLNGDGDPCACGLDWKTAKEQAEFVRQNMGGAGFGLPCYINSDRFCYVHNTIGGLQAGQQAQTVESEISVCSRELTEEEKKHAAAVDTLARKGNRDGEEAPVATPVTPAAPARGPIDLSDGFCCPEHKEFEKRCRYCLAASIINGGYEPDCVVFVSDANGDRFVEADKLDELLTKSGAYEIALYVRSVAWKRELVLQKG